VSPEIAESGLGFPSRRRRSQPGENDFEELRLGALCHLKYPRPLQLFVWTISSSCGFFRGWLRKHRIDLHTPAHPLAEEFCALPLDIP
jgi:hypothetical protein